MEGKKHLGIFIESYYQETVFTDFVKALLDGDKVKVTFIFCRVISAPRRRPINLQSTFFRTWQKVNSLLSSQSDKVDVRELGDKLNWVKVSVSIRKRIYHSLSDEDILLLERLEFDFLFRYGLNIVEGKVLNISKHGIYSFHHGNNSTYRGRPSAFWEKIRGEHKLEGMLQTLGNRLDDGNIIAKWNIPNHGYSMKVLQSKNRRVGFKVLLSLLNQESGLNMSQKYIPIYRPGVNKIPNNYNVIRYFLIRSKEIAFNRYQRIWRQDWSIVVYNSNKLVNTITAPGKDFVADPFVVAHGAYHYVFYEYWDSKKAKGRIDVRLFEGTKFILEKTLIEENFHLSFPNVVQHEDSFYIVPEMRKSNCQMVYDLDLQSLTIIDKRVILEGVSIADPQVIFKDDHFYLMGSEDDVLLYCWIGNNLSSKWSGRKKLIDADIANVRGAGAIFVHEENIIRPVQQITKRYGEKLFLQSIEFSWDKGINVLESTEINSQWFNRVDGVHTYNKSGEGYFEVFDLLNYRLRFL